MMKKIKLTRYPLTALAVVVIWTLCLIPIPETPLNQISLIDKWTHLVLFGGLTVIIWAEMLRDDKRRIRRLSARHAKSFQGVMRFGVAWPHG